MSSPQSFTRATAAPPQGYTCGASALGYTGLRPAVEVAGDVRILVLRSASALGTTHAPAARASVCSRLAAWRRKEGWPCYTTPANAYGFPPIEVFGSPSEQGEILLIRRSLESSRGVPSACSSPFLPAGGLVVGQPLLS